jgi:hypothetical protein
MSRLAELVAAYDQRIEAGRGALLREMDELGGGAEARRLADSPDAGGRRLAARLMHLLPEPEHVDALERLVADPDGAVAAEARRAMRIQRRTPEWHAAVDRLTTATDPALRDTAATWNAESRS